KAVVGTLRDRLAGPLTDDQADLVSSADRHINRLTRLLNNFLDLSRLESRRARVNLRPMDPAELVRDVSDGARMAHQGRPEIRVELPPSLPEVTADSDMIAQVLGNLLDNALRYAKVRVLVSAAATPEGVEFSVTDDGPGIPPDGLADLFNKFVQLDRPKGG